MIKTEFKFKEYNIEIKEVENDIEFNDFYSTYYKVFEQWPEEIFPRDKMYHFYKDGGKNYTDMLFLITIDSKPSGIYYLLHKKFYPVANIPWLGLIPEYQGKNIFHQIERNLEGELTKLGIEIIVIECDNPKKLRYESSRSLAEARIRFYKKLGYKFVSDKDLPYLRNKMPLNGQGDIKTVENFYILGFKIISNNTNFITLNKDSIKKEDYKKLYLSIRRLEFEGEDIDIEPDQLPAEHQFLKNLELFHNNFIELT